MDQSAANQPGDRRSSSQVWDDIRSRQSDTSAVVTELGHRVTRVTDLRYQLTSNPRIVAGAAVAGAVVIGGLLIFALTRSRRSVAVAGDLAGALATLQRSGVAITVSPQSADGGAGRFLLRAATAAGSAAAPMIAKRLVDYVQTRQGSETPAGFR